jgi:hypothetical protein
MKVGDLVRRKKPLQPALYVADTLRLGIVTGLRLGGSVPYQHKIASVFYAGTLQQYDIAVSLIEVVA